MKNAFNLLNAVFLFTVHTVYCVQSELSDS